MNIFLKAYNSLCEHMYKNKFHTKVIVMCNEKVVAHTAAAILTKLANNLNGAIIFYRSNEMYITVKYGYFHIVFQSAYDPTWWVNRKDYKVIRSTDIAEAVKVLKPKRAFKYLFRKED